MAPRRLLALLGLVGLTLACLVLPAAAQPSPGISLDPAEAPAGPSSETWSILVRGVNWSPGPVTIQFEGQTLATTSPRPDGTFAVTITPAKRNAGFYQVTALQNPCGPSSSCPVGRAATFRAVPSSSHNNPCGPFGSTANLNVTGSFFAPRSFAQVFYDSNGPDRQERQQIPTGTGTFTVTFSIVLRDRPITIEVYDSQENSAPILVFHAAPCPTTTVPPTTTTTGHPVIGSTTTTEPPPIVPGVTTTSSPPNDPPPPTPPTLPPTIELPPPTPGATLTLSPRIGPTGFVTGVTGTGFPPGPVALVWLPGIGTTTTIAGLDGRISTRVLVLPGDRLGPRALVATGAGGVTAVDAFLVVPSTVQPSGQEVSQINRVRRFNNR